MTSDGLPKDAQVAHTGSRAAQRGTSAFKYLALALALALPGPVLAAGFTCAKQSDSGTKGALDELDEVVITDAEPRTNTKDLQAWLRLLVGRYYYDGYVDLCGRGNAKDQRAVMGNADCIGSGSTPNVHCSVNVRWPLTRDENGAPVLGGESNMLPALVIYTLEGRYVQEKQLHHWSLMFTQVDDKGVAEWGLGTLVGDTFTSREPCVGIPGACRKITRITARPGSNEISMVSDVEIDGERVLRQAFLLHRESDARKEIRSGSSGQ